MEEIVEWLTYSVDTNSVIFSIIVLANFRVAQSINDQFVA